MKYENPEITVFMPVYNAEEFLREAIDSVLNQTFKNFELLIVNDGSTDHSEEIIRSYEDSRIVLVNNEKNMGLPYSRNRGLQLARGKYLAIMDSDDIADEKRLELQYDVMERNPNLAVVASDKEFITDGVYYSYGLKEKLFSYLFYRKPEQIQTDLIFHNVLTNSTTMSRLEFIKTNSISYNPTCIVMQDYEFWTQVCGKCGKVKIIRKPLVKYRTHTNNISTKTRNNKIEMRRKIQHDIQLNYMLQLGFKVDSEIEQFIWEFGKEFEDQSVGISREYMDKLYLYYEKIIKESKNSNVLKHNQVRSYLRQKYLLLAVKSPKKVNYILKAMFLR